MRARRGAIAGAVAAVLMMAGPAQAANRAGTLDTRYGVDGTGGVELAQPMRSVLYGSTGDAIVLTDVGTLTRLTPAGRIDRAFGVRGVGVLPGPAIADMHAVRLNDGGAVFAGASAGVFPPEAIVVAKVRRDGKPDATFGGGDGSIEYPPTDFAFNEIRTAAVTADGRVFIGGNTDRGPATVRRIERDGALTTTRCGTTPAVQVFPGDRIEASGARGDTVVVSGVGIDLVTFTRGLRVRIMDSCGRTLHSVLLPQPATTVISPSFVVPVGDGWLVGSQEAIIRIDRNGDLVPSFGTGGYVVMNELTPTGFLSAGSVAVDGRGRIVVGGGLFTDTATVGVTLRLLGNGALDPSYGDGGIAPITGVSGLATGAGPVGVDPENRVLAVTASFTADFLSFTLVAQRYLG